MKAIKSNTKEPLNRRKWVKGFTLLETLIVILLTALVVAMTFLYLNTFNKYISQVNNNSEYELQVLRMESFLEYDIDRSNSIILQEENIIELPIDGSIIEYQINESSVVRIQDEVVDTLKCSALSLCPKRIKGLGNELEGFELEIKDFNGRSRMYSFNRLANAKSGFQTHWENER